MPNAKIIIDRWVISGRGDGALLAWKLDGRGTVVDVVVVLGGDVGGSIGVYRRIRGEETVNIKQTNASTDTRHVGS